MGKTYRRGNQTKSDFKKVAKIPKKEKYRNRFEDYDPVDEKEDLEIEKKK